MPNPEGKPLRLSDAPNALVERIKELNCLYGISRLLEKPELPLDWVMQKAVELIPEAWQHPSIASARIRIEDQLYKVSNFRETRWRLHEAIVFSDTFIGEVDVCYVEEPPGKTDAPFLEEEGHLLKAIAERLGKVVQLKRSEQELRESQERYRILSEQVGDGVTLVQDGVFHYVNPAFCGILNISAPERIIGTRLPLTDSGSAGSIRRLFRNVDAEASIKGEDVVAELSGPDKGTWIQARHHPISYRGRPALLSTFRDITRFKEQQAAAEEMASHLSKENKVLRSSLKERYRLGNILGRSLAMQEVYELILKAAVTEASVAIFGESGVGKELAALQIHAHSSRKSNRFVPVNCGAVQESLFEREFFGHRKGSFSSAHADAPGYLDMADGGTLFLDEVGELTVPMQAKLLRAFEGGDYRPVGSTINLSADLRIISASNADLTEKVTTGSMRSDFYYRIQVLQIKLPPLRQRKEDIPLLVEHFIKTLKTPSDRSRVPGAVMDVLMDYDWPGNVRELRNVIQRYLTLGHVEFLSPGTNTAEPPTDENELNLRIAVQKLEQRLVKEALQQTAGNRTQAAALLGISRRALFRKTDTNHVT